MSYIFCKPCYSWIKQTENAHKLNCAINNDNYSNRSICFHHNFFIDIRPTLKIWAQIKSLAPTGINARMSFCTTYPCKEINLDVWSKYRLSMSDTKWCFYNSKQFKLILPVQLDLHGRRSTLGILLTVSYIQPPGWTR